MGTMPPPVKNGRDRRWTFRRLSRRKSSHTAAGPNSLRSPTSISVRAQEIASLHGTQAVTDYRDLIGEVDAVSIAVPTSLHEEVATPFLDSACHVLVEKPIAHDVDSATRMIELAQKRGVVLQVGHLPRFYDVVERLSADVARPLFIDAVRIAPFKTRGTDVNVILDLMVHDLDLVLTLVDAPLVSVDAAGAPVISETEDIANARLKFANGCVATITASRISLKTERKMRIFQGDAYFTIDFDASRVRAIRKSNSGRELMPGVPDVDIKEGGLRGGRRAQTRNRCVSHLRESKGHRHWCPERTACARWKRLSWLTNRYAPTPLL